MPQNRRHPRPKSSPNELVCRLVVTVRAHPIEKKCTAQVAMIGIRHLYAMKSASLLRARRYTGDRQLVPCTMTSPSAYRPLDMEDVADVFRVTTRTIENWVQQGVLPTPAKIGNRVFWCPDAFNAWLRERLKEPKDLQAESTHDQPQKRSGGKDVELRQLRGRTDKRITKILAGVPPHGD